MTTTVAYMRVSTEAQQDGNGIEQQRLSIMAWAAANRVHIDEWVTEAATGTKRERVEISALVERAKCGEITRLVVDRMDRLGRLLLVSEALYAELRAAGVTVELVSQKLGDSPTEVAMRQMAGVFAELQRSEWLARMRQCKVAAVRKKGAFVGGRLPYGYRTQGNGKVTTDPRTAKVVQACFEMKAQGMTQVQIVEALDRAGFRTARGTRIAQGQVSKILSRAAAYRGQAPISTTVTLEAGVRPVQPALLEETPFMHVRSPDRQAST